MDNKKLQKIILDQRQEIDQILEGKNIIDREDLLKWGGAVDTDLIKVVCGARRAGKSVFSFQLLTGMTHAYMNFDDERLRDTIMFL